MSHKWISVLCVYSANTGLYSFARTGKGKQKFYLARALDFSRNSASAAETGAELANAGIRTQDRNQLVQPTPCHGPPQKRSAGD